MTDSSRSRTWALAALTATQLMVILDGTIVNVALPTIRADLGFSGTGLAWVVNAFFVAFALLLLPAGRLADLVGARRVFLGGLVGFTAASALCGLAPSAELLVGARFLQGVGGALASAVVLGMITRLFEDDERRRTQAFGLLAFVGAAGASIGVVAGGLLVDLASWRWVFLVNVPIGLLTAVVALRHLGPVHGDRTGRGSGSGLVPAVLFRSRRFVVANGVLLTMTMAGFSFQFLSALYLQDVLGLDPMATGLSYLPVTLAIAVSSLVLSGRLAERYGAARALVGGLVLFVGGLLLLARTPADGTFWIDVAPAFLVMGAGFGLAMPQVTSVAMSDAPSEHSGAASGLVTTTQQVGGVIGLAVVSVVADGAGLGAGLLVAAVVLAGGTTLATTLLRTGPRAGRLPAEQPPAPTLERC
ncbi:DHA2 family efflux MFS transporter permease subunit [Nocardioides endophyticus]|uniref:DHA2 family efflux MFS transporter permease subunit n=1 Tax=Nocardioides endophyticus TaxID=1353775 RepID=A0ABP8YLS1_9ACTN